MRRVVVACLALSGLAATDALNGFALGDLRVNRDKLVAGGPGRDKIHSVDEPAFAEPAAASWVAAENLVIGVSRDGAARAYPVHVMEYHQIVNDEIGGVPVVVTYDPIAGVPIAYVRRVGERTLEFGVSGLIYNSNFLLYDRATESLWSQFRGEAIAGPLAGTRLERLRVRQEPLGRWLERAPKTRVLGLPAPRRIDYRYSPFTAYWLSEKVPFPVEASDPSFHPKELVLGLRAGGKTRAYLGSLVTGAGGILEDRFEGHDVRVGYTSELAAFDYEVPDAIEVTEAYWFAWKAFHPDTEVWKER